jgi:HD-GYP domain-containing protein (c-di-GMP phosphodiesterase class II)
LKSNFDSRPIGTPDSQRHVAVNTRRYLGILVLVQVACMACGLAFHYFYVNSAMRHEVETRLFHSLLEQSKALADKIESEHGAAVHDPQADTGARSLVLHASHAADEDALLVDRTGLVVFDPQTPPSGPVRSIVWIRSSAAWGGGDAPIRGLIQGKSGVEAAVAQPLPRTGGYLLLAGTINEQPLRLAELFPVLRIAGGLALLWTTGLAGAAIFLLVSHNRGKTDKAAEPDAESLKNSQALMRTQETVIFGLAKLSDSRDPDTGDHLERISYYSSTLAAALRQHPDFRNDITPTFIRLIGISSALHDIGKVGVEDAILRKPGPLTLEERELMTRHTRIGEECLREIERRLGTSNFLQMAREIAASHHERWDGTGYPQGLAAEDIPLSARIVAIADVYDALSSKRVYKAPLSHEECVSTIAAEAGKHFDPRLVQVFLEIESSFRNISRHLKPEEAGDNPAESAADQPLLASPKYST